MVFQVLSYKATRYVLVLRSIKYGADMFLSGFHVVRVLFLLRVTSYYLREANG